MNCPLCKQQLLEIETGYQDTIDFICRNRVAFPDNPKRTWAHFEWGFDDDYYIIRMIPFILIIFDDRTEIFANNGDPFKIKFLFVLKNINKKNIYKVMEDSEQVYQKIKKLTIFS